MVREELGHEQRRGCPPGRAGRLAASRCLRGTLRGTLPTSLRWAPLALLSAGLLAACTPAQSEASAAPPDEIERLAFVRAGRGALTQTLEWSLSEALLVDRFEVTRGQWNLWLDERAGAADSASWQTLGPVATNGHVPLEYLPATSMTLAEARDFARDLGMRLPTASEWMYIASGARCQSYPWGSHPRDSCANTLELGLRRLVPVGSFENGKSQRGVHDLIGNVWEWVEEPLARGLPQKRGTISLSLPDDCWIMGGSYLTRMVPLHEEGSLVFAKAVAAGYRASDTGLRCVVEAQRYLEARALELSREDMHERLIALGSRWGAHAIALLEGLETRTDSAPAIGWLLEGARR